MNFIIQYTKDRLNSRDESGAMLAVVAILSTFVFIVAMSLLTTIVFSTETTYNSRAKSNTLMAAETGIDNALFQAVAGFCNSTGTDSAVGYDFKVYGSTAADAPTSVDDPTVSHRCPQPGDTYMLIESSGTDERGRDTTVVATYQWTRNAAALPVFSDGAIVTGGGNVNFMNLRIVGAEGNIIFANGNFGCNNNPIIDGDVVIMNGSANITNYCRIEGDLIASGNVHLDSYSFIGGNVYAGGNFSMTNSSRVNGNVEAKGSLNVSSNPTILGSLTSTSTAQAYFYNARVGSIHVNGTINGQALTVNGNLTAKGTGTSQLAPTVNSTGRIAVGGNISTWSGGPTATLGVFTNQNLHSPTVNEPKELAPDYFKWTEYDYDPSQWQQAGYTIVNKTGSCDYQNNAALRNEVNNYTVPTVLDLRNCSNLRLYNVNFNLRTDLTMITNGFNDNRLTITSRNGQPIRFNIIVPDMNPADNRPTCHWSQSNLGLYQFAMGSNVEGSIYTPCQVSLGGPPSTINGKVYSGSLAYSGSGLTINHSNPTLPGLIIEPGTAVGGGFEYEESRAVPTLVARSE